MFIFGVTVVLYFLQVYTGSVLTIFKQYTLKGKSRVSNSKRHVIQRKQTRENLCGLCLNANSCMIDAELSELVKILS